MWHIFLHKKHEFFHHGYARHVMWCMAYKLPHVKFFLMDMVIASIVAWTCLRMRCLQMHVCIFMFTLDSFQIHLGILENAHIKKKQHKMWWLIITTFNLYHPFPPMGITTKIHVFKTITKKFVIKIPRSFKILKCLRTYFIGGYSHKIY